MIGEKLQADRELLKKQLFWIEVSLNECEETGVREHYSVEEFENQRTLVNIVNNAHKRGSFQDIDKLRIMKDVRNTIVHEYIEDALTEVFDEVLEYSKELVEIIHNSLEYIDTKCQIECQIE